MFPFFAKVSVVTYNYQYTCALSTDTRYRWGVGGCRSRQRGSSSCSTLSRYRLHSPNSYIIYLWLILTINSAFSLILTTNIYISANRFIKS